MPAGLVLLNHQPAKFDILFEQKSVQQIVHEPGSDRAGIVHILLYVY